MNIYVAHPTTYNRIHTHAVLQYLTSWLVFIRFCSWKSLSAKGRSDGRSWAVRGKVRILHRTSCFRGGKFIADFRDVSKSFCTTLHWIGCKLSGNAEIEHNLSGGVVEVNVLIHWQAGLVTCGSRRNVKDCLFVVKIWSNNLIRS